MYSHVNCRNFIGNCYYNVQYTGMHYCYNNYVLAAPGRGSVHAGPWSGDPGACSVCVWRGTERPPSPLVRGPTRYTLCV